MVSKLVMKSVTKVQIMVYLLHIAMLPVLLAVYHHLALSVVMVVQLVAIQVHQSSHLRFVMKVQL
jgi:hypothetical protein